MTKLKALLLTVFIPTLACAEAYLSANFANSIPSTFTLKKADGGQLQANIYQNIGKDMSAAWVAGQLANGYGRVAMSPTRNADPALASDNWMILPTVKVADSEAVLRWEARSLHKHIAETYYVAARKSGTDSWTTLYACAGESYAFTTHCISLGAYEGCDVEIAFVATTLRGFILAVDNIFVGVPDDDHFVFRSTTPHYVGDDGTATISGRLTYYGSQSSWDEIRLTIGDDTQSTPLPPMSCGESIDIEYTIHPSTGETYAYTLAAAGPGKSIQLHSDFITCSHYSRHHLVDRCSGTWCINCPTAELTTTRLENSYGDQLTVLEAHVNDELTNRHYWDDYLSAFTFSIPAFVPNHDSKRMTTSIKSTDDYSASLDRETIAAIRLTATEGAHGEVTLSSETEFAMHIDNAADRYRVAYMLIADVHDAYTPQYLQSSQSTSYRDEQYYYQPDYILPEMMYYDNVPIEASVSYQGVPCSLPAAIEAKAVYSHSFTLKYPTHTDYSNIRAIAMVIDTETSRVLNAFVATPGDINAAPAIGTDSTTAPVELYDLSGRRISQPGSGIYIARKGNSAYKILNSK